MVLIFQIFFIVFLDFFTLREEVDLSKVLLHGLVKRIDQLQKQKENAFESGVGATMNREIKTHTSVPKVDALPTRSSEYAFGDNKLNVDC